MRHPRRWAAAAFLLVVVAAGAWLGIRALAARDHLDAARAEIPALRTALLSDDHAAVSARLTAVQRETRAARRLTSDPVWRVAARVPYLGRTLRTAGGLAAAVDDLAKDTLPSLDAASQSLSLRSLRPSGDTVALGPLESAHAPLAAVRDSVAASEERVRALPVSGVVGSVAEARADFLAELATLRRSTSDAALAVGLAPAMLGRDGVRRYFVAILNNAEMRGSGGLLGAYGILEADRGKLRMRELGTNASLRDAPAPVVPPSPRYQRFGADRVWLNANMSPHFPDASRVWTALWERQHRERLDGTIAIDPVALSALLRVTGPAGEVTADNVVDLTERDAYRRFAKDNDARDRYLQQVARASYLKVVSGAGDTVTLVRALASVAGTRHLQVASAHSAEAALLESTPLGGAMPSPVAPYLEVLAQNAGGNKLDYYVRRTVSYTRSGDEVTVEVRLRNDAPPGLPPYVTNRLDLPGLVAPVKGQQRLYVSVYAGTALLGATLDGAEVALESETDHGHAVFSVFLDVDPGAERVLVLRVRERRTESLVVRQQPVVFPDVVKVGA